MSVVVSLKPIKPKPLRVDAIRLELLNELRKEGTVQRKELKKTTETWRGEKPEFESLIGLERKAGGSAMVVTGPTGSKKAVSKWEWLNSGTRIRWAVMSRDWRSKTRPRRFSSRPGRGRVVIAGRRAMTMRNIRPRPGIKAREWTVLLSKKRKRPFSRRMGNAMKRGAFKVFL
jgi:hypothetical protein